MNSLEAKEILLLYRPSVDGNDPEFSEALALTKSDPELAVWFQQHCAFQDAARSAFNDIPVPEALKEQILSECKAHLTLNSRRRALVGACAIMVIAFVGVITFRSFQAPKPDTSFASFHSRMIGMILRYPKMDIETNDLQAIRQELAKHGQTPNLAFTAPLDKTSGTGCATLTWHDKQVSMVCFNSGKNGAPKKPDLFLFVIDKGALKDPPPRDPKITQVRKSLVSGSWTSGDKIYVLAALGGEDFLRQYF